MTARQILLLALLLTSGILVVGQLYGVIPLDAAIAAQFRVRPGDAAWVGSVFGFGYAPGFLLFGSTTDRIGGRRTAVLGLGLLAIVTTLVGRASSFDTLLLARFVQGVCASSFAPAALSLVAETLSARVRPLGVSIVSFSFLAAAPIAQFAVVRSGQSLSTLMLVTAPVYVVCAVAVFHASPASRMIPPGAPVGDSVDVRLLIAEVGILGTWIAAATVLFSFVVYQSSLRTLAQAAAIDPQYLRLIGLPALLATLSAPSLIKRCGAPRTAQLGVLLIVAAFLSATYRKPAPLIAASIFLEAGVATAIPGMIATVIERAPAPCRGLGIGIYACILFLGASAGPPVGHLLGQSGKVAFYLVPTSLLSVAALVLQRVICFRISALGLEKSVSG